MPNLPAELVVVAKEADYVKLPYVLGAADRHIADLTAIHLITPTPVTLKPLPRLPLFYHLDHEVLPYDRKQLKYRPSWIFQQFLKLFQDVTATDWYQVIDADVYVNKNLPLWTKEGQPILYLARNQNHGPYFEFNRKFLGYGRVFNHSFLSEVTFYSKFLINNMLNRMNLRTVDAFWQRCVELIDDGAYPAESELYGSYVTREHPYLYAIRKIRASLGGRYGEHVWTPEEIEWEISEQMKLNGNDIDLISLHSWNAI